MRCLLNSLMRASHVVILVDIFKQNTPQMGGIQEKDQIQAFFSDSPDPTFGVRIGIGCLEGGMNDVKGFTLKDDVKGTGELAIIVVDQETEGGFSGIKLPNQLSGLLGDPDIIGVVRNAGEMHSAGAEFDEEEHIEGLQADGFEGEEVAGQDLIFVMAHEVTPGDGAAANACREDPVPVVEHIANG